MINALVARKIQFFLQVMLCISILLLEARKLSYCLVNSLRFVEVMRNQRKDVLLALQMSAVGSSAQSTSDPPLFQQQGSTSSRTACLKPMSLEASQKLIWVSVGCTGLGSGANRLSATVLVHGQAEERQMVLEGGQRAGAAPHLTQSLHMPGQSGGGLWGPKVLTHNFIWVNTHSFLDLFN